MLDKLTYTNNAGDSIVIGEGGIYCSENDLRAIKWDIEVSNGRAVSLTRNLFERTLPMQVRLDDDGVGNAAKDRILSVVDADLESGTPGKASINGFELRCFVKEVALSDYLYRDGSINFNLKIQPVDGIWRRETIVPFRIDSNVDWSTDKPDYPWDYPRGYRPDPAVRVITNPSVSDALLGFVVYGPVKSPSIRIGTNTYAVDVDVPAGSLLVIDPIEHTVHLVGEDGSLTNAFRYRDRGMVGSGHYIFAPIPSGTQTVSFDNSFAFDAHLIEERGEPTWS